jgi:hypothetical protein
MSPSDPKRSRGVLAEYGSIGRCVIPISVWSSADPNVSGARWAYGTLTVCFSACEAAIFSRD